MEECDKGRKQNMPDISHIGISTEITLSSNNGHIHPAVKSRKKNKNYIQSHPVKKNNAGENKNHCHREKC